MRSAMQKLGRLLALATVVLAVAAPAASARHAADYFQTNPAPAYSTPGGAAGYVPSPAQGPVTVSGDGFDWGDAGIGATAVLAVAAIAAGALITVRHRPGHGRLA